MILDPALGGGVAYVGLCKDPKLVKWNAGGNTASEKILTCPDCTGGKCAVYYLRTGEAGYENYWRPVTPEEEPLKKKFSLDDRGRLKIDPADLEDLQKEFVFRCFCVS